MTASWCSLRIWTHSLRGFYQGSSAIGSESDHIEKRLIHSAYSLPISIFAEFYYMN
jgi:hypothetical protein